MGSSRVQVKCPSCQHSFLPALDDVQSRAGKSARRKGHAFERKVAKQLQDWWVISGQSYLFRRTPMSGGSTLKDGWGLAGDIATTAPTFNWHLELKNAPGSFAGLHQLISADKCKIWGWLNQAIHDCPPFNNVMLIVNRYDQPTWCITPRVSVIERLGLCGVDFFSFYSKRHDINLIIWSFDDMLKTSPQIWDK